MIRTPMYCIDQCSFQDESETPTSSLREFVYAHDQIKRFDTNEIAFSTKVRTTGFNITETSSTERQEEAEEEEAQFGEHELSSSITNGPTNQQHNVLSFGIKRTEEEFSTSTNTTKLITPSLTQIIDKPLLDETLVGLNSVTTGSIISQSQTQSCFPKSEPSSIASSKTFSHQFQNNTPKVEIPKKQFSKKWAWLNEEGAERNDSQTTGKSASVNEEKVKEFSSISSRLRSLSLTTASATDRDPDVPASLPTRKRSMRIKEMAKRFEAASNTSDVSDKSSPKVEPLIPPKRVPLSNLETYSTETMRLEPSPGVQYKFRSTEAEVSKKQQILMDPLQRETIAYTTLVNGTKDEVKSKEREAGKLTIKRNITTANVAAWSGCETKLETESSEVESADLLRSIDAKCIPDITQNFSRITQENMESSGPARETTSNVLKPDNVPIVSNTSKLTGTKEISAARSSLDCSLADNVDLIKHVASNRTVSKIAVYDASVLAVNETFSEMKHLDCSKNKISSDHELTSSNADHEDGSISKTTDSRNSNDEAVCKKTPFSEAKEDTSGCKNYTPSKLTDLKECKSYTAKATENRNCQVDTQTGGKKTLFAVNVAMKREDETRSCENKTNFGTKESNYFHNDATSRVKESAGSIMVEAGVSLQQCTVSTEQTTISCLTSENEWTKSTHTTQAKPNDKMERSPSFDDTSLECFGNVHDDRAFLVGKHPGHLLNRLYLSEDIADIIADDSEEVIFEKKLTPTQRLYSFLVDEDETSYQITSLSAMSDEELPECDPGSVVENMLRQDVKDSFDAGNSSCTAAEVCKSHTVTAYASEKAVLSSTDKEVSVAESVSSVEFSKDNLPITERISDQLVHVEKMSERELISTEIEETESSKRELISTEIEVEEAQCCSASVATSRCPDFIADASECVSVNNYSREKVSDQTNSILDDVEIRGFEKYDSSEIESVSVSPQMDQCFSFSGTQENSLENRPSTPSPPSSQSSTNAEAHHDQQRGRYLEVNAEEDNIPNIPEHVDVILMGGADRTAEVMEGDSLRSQSELDEDRTSITQTSLSSVLGTDEENQPSLKKSQTLGDGLISELKPHLNDTPCHNHDSSTFENGVKGLSLERKEIVDKDGHSESYEASCKPQNLDKVSSCLNNIKSYGEGETVQYSTFVKRREISSQQFSDITRRNFLEDHETVANVSSFTSTCIKSEKFDHVFYDQHTSNRSSLDSTSCSEVSESTTECSDTSLQAPPESKHTSIQPPPSVLVKDNHDLALAQVRASGRLSLNGGELFAVKVKVDPEDERSMSKLRDIQGARNKWTERREVERFSEKTEIRVEDMDEISGATFLTAEDIEKINTEGKTMHQQLIIGNQSEDDYDFLGLSPQLHKRRSVSPRMDISNFERAGMITHHDHTIDYDYIISPGKSQNSLLAELEFSPEEDTGRRSVDENLDSVKRNGFNELTCTGVAKVTATNRVTTTKFQRKKSYQPLEQIRFNLESSDIVSTNESSRNVTFSTADFNKKLIEHEPEPNRSKSWKKNSLKGLFRKMKSKSSMNHGVDLEPETIEPEMQISSPILISSSSQSRTQQKSGPNAGSYSITTQKVTLEELSVSELDISQTSAALSSGVQVINRVDGFFIPNQNQYGLSNASSIQNSASKEHVVRGQEEDMSGAQQRLVFKKSDPRAPDPFSYQTEKHYNARRGGDLEQSTRSGIEKLAKVMKWKRK